MRYFTADLHLHHPKLAALRGFPSVAAHDAAIMAQLYQLDPDTDELWVLGDICTGGVASMEAALEQLSTLRLPLHLVAGNHDPAHPMHHNAGRHRDTYVAVFETVRHEAQVEIAGTAVVLSHFPYRGTPDRFSRQNFDQWQLPDRGDWLIHGHTHDEVRRSGARSICVSLEAWDLRPASEAELIAEMGA